MALKQVVRSPLTIDGAELRLVRLPLVTPFTIATGTMHEKLFPLVRLFSGDLEGVAEAVMDPLPDYLEETTAGAMDFLSNVLLPDLIGKSFANPQALARHLAPWRGNRMAGRWSRWRSGISGRNRFAAAANRAWRRGKCHRRWRLAGDRHGGKHAGPGAEPS